MLQSSARELTLCAALLGGPVVAVAAELPADSPAAADVASEQSAVGETRVETTRRAVGSRISSLARWIDAFFDDPLYTEEEADARLTLRQSVKFLEHADPEYQTHIRWSVSLPNTSRRLRLVFEGDDDLDTDDVDEVNNVDEPDIEQSVEDSVDDSSLGFQQLLLSNVDYDLRLRIGVRLSDRSIYLGPRFRVQADLGEQWRSRLTQRVRWYSRDGWRTDTNLGFDRRIGERNLFRQAFATTWREEEFQPTGFRHTATTSLVQPLSDTSAMRYGWSSVYLTEPTPGWTSSVLSVGYRTAVWRKWLVLDIRPFLSWREANDWEAQRGMMISLSMLFEDESLTPRPHIE